MSVRELLRIEQDINIDIQDIQDGQDEIFVYPEYPEYLADPC